MEKKMPTKADVKKFWESEPLFTGEAGAKGLTKEFYEEHEKVYIDDCFAGSIEEFYFEGLQGKRVVDVGCGPGFWVRQFSKRGIDITGVDLTEAGIKLARKSIELYDYDAKLLVGDAENLPFPDESFDHVNCQGVIHHTPDTAACLKEFHRVLKPGGTMMVSVYHKNFLLSHPRALKIAAAPLRLFGGGLKGRGREKMLADFRDADDLVRLYDGANNPLGKCYSSKEFEAMVTPYFKITHRSKTFFPLRAFSLPVPKSLHKNLLHKHFGLLIVVGGAKK